MLHIETKKISLAASDSHLCVAHFSDGDSEVTFDLFDKQGCNTCKRVPNVDEQFFQMFSCFGGIVFQNDQNGFRALRTENANVEVTDRWEIHVSNLMGFYYNEGEFHHHFYEPAASNLKLWKFSDCAYPELYLDCRKKVFVSSTNLNIIPFVSNLTMFYVHHGTKDHLKKDIVTLGDFGQSKIRILTNMRASFETVNRNVVAIAYSIMENECEFTYQAYDSERYQKVGPNHFRSVEIKGVDSIQFFNSDCYFATKEGLILRLDGFLSEV